MRVYLCGQRHFGASVFEQLYAMPLVKIVGVSSPAYSSALTTTGEPLPDRLRAVADRVGVPWLPAGQLRAVDVAAARVDLIVAAHSHDFLGRATRQAAKLGAIGYHPSFLPLHRGRDAVRWTIKMRDRITGGTVYWLDQNVDGGPIAAQEPVLVHPDDTVESLWRERLAPLGVRMLAQVVQQLAKTGHMVAVPQVEECATWEPSWSRPPIFRPELPQLGDGPAGYTTTTYRE